MSNEKDSLELATLDVVRLRRGFTQQSLARAMGTGQGVIWTIERRHRANASTLKSYIEALGGNLEIRAVFEHDVFLLVPYSSGTGSQLAQKDTVGPAGTLQVTAEELLRNPELVAKLKPMFETIFREMFENKIHEEERNKSKNAEEIPLQESPIDISIGSSINSSNPIILKSPVPVSVGYLYGFSKPYEFSESASNENEFQVPLKQYFLSEKILGINDADVWRERQLAIHFNEKEFNFQLMSSTGDNDSAWELKVSVENQPIQTATRGRLCRFRSQDKFDGNTRVFIQPVKNCL